MSNDPIPNTAAALEATLPQLIDAVQLMQGAVSSFNLLVESNTRVSESLCIALNAVIASANERARASSATAATAPAQASDPSPTTGGTGAPQATPASSTPEGLATTVPSSTLSGHVNSLRALQNMLDSRSTIAGVECDPLPEPHYAVIVGRNPGVFQGSDGVPENVDRIPGNRVIRITTGRQDALDRFNALLRAGQVERVQLVVKRSILQPGDSGIPGV